MSERADILAKLEIALNGLKDDPSYEANPATVSMFDERYLAAPPSDFPWLMILDDLPEEKAAEDNTHVTFSMNLIVRCIIKADYKPELVLELNQLQSSIKQLLYSTPSLGDNVLSVLYAGGDGLIYYPDQGFGVADIRFRILYWTTRSAF